MLRFGEILKVNCLTEFSYPQTGSAIVSSYGDLSSVDIDPHIQVIKELKENIFDMSIVV